MNNANRTAATEMHVDLAKPLINMLCCCCGERFKGRQFHNQDTGYGLCPCCVAYVTPRTEDVARTFGIEGVHYNVFISYEHGSDLDTRICFAVGELGREELEETATAAEVDFDKWTSSDDLRSLVIEAARERRGIKVFDAEGGVTTYGFSTNSPLPRFYPGAAVPIPCVASMCKQLSDMGYFAGARDQAVKPEFTGVFMVNDPSDLEGFAIVGDDLDSLIVEAYGHLVVD